jgi:hypothetical protein
VGRDCLNRSFLCDCFHAASPYLGVYFQNDVTTTRLSEPSLSAA